MDFHGIFLSTHGGKKSIADCHQGHEVYGGRSFPMAAAPKIFAVEKMGSQIVRAKTRSFLQLPENTGFFLWKSPFAQKESSSSKHWF